LTPIFHLKNQWHSIFKVLHVFISLFLPMSSSFLLEGPL
jgi:hypothetical protein